MEKVRSKLQDLLETSNNASALIRKTIEPITVSNRAARLPVVVSNPADFGAVNLNGGALGLGSGMVTAHMEISYFPTKLGIEITTEAMWTTDSAEKAIKDAFRENLRRAMLEAQIFDDIAFHNITGTQGIIARGDGTTAIGGTNPFSAGQSATIRLDNEFACQLLRQNMPVEIFTTNLATHKTAANSPDALPRVSAIDVAGKTVTITGSPNQTGSITLANTDVLCFAGVGSTPTFRYGLYAFNTTTTSGSLLNLSRTAIPEINSNFVNASNSTVSAAHILLLKHQIAMRRGKVDGLVGLAHPAQLAQIADLGTAISTWMRGSSDKMIDIVPGIGDSQLFGGIEFRMDVRQSRSRLDVINPSNWTRVRLRDLDWYEVDGQKVFEKRSANGGVATSVLLYLVSAENFACVDPGSQGFIFNLSIPAGY